MHKNDMDIESPAIATDKTTSVDAAAADNQSAMNTTADFSTPYSGLNGAAARLLSTFEALKKNRVESDGSVSTSDAPVRDTTITTQVKAINSRVNRLANLDDFVPGKKNQVSFNIATSILDIPGQYSPLAFWGGSGLGKTHLLQGIYSQCVRRKIKSIYCTAEQFTADFQEALRSHTGASFRTKFQRVQFFLLDDLDFLQDKKYTLIELNTIVSELLSHGTQVVFSCCDHPRNLTGLGKSIQGLFDGGLVCQLHPAEYETRMEIIRRMAANRKISLPSEAIQTIASQISGNVREIIGVLNRLEVCLMADASACSGSGAMDKIQNILDDWVRDTNFMVSLAKIEKTVCQAFDLQDTDLKSPNRSRQCSYPRMLAMWLARKFTRKALSEIGEYFGSRSHSTVISAQKRVDEWIVQGRVIDMNNRSSEITVALQSLEERLRHCL